MTNGVFLLNIYIHILRVHVYMSCSYVCTDDHDDYPPKILIRDKVHKIRLFLISFIFLKLPYQEKSTLNFSFLKVICGCVSCVSYSPSIIFVCLSVESAQKWFIFKGFSMG